MVGFSGIRRWPIMFGRRSGSIPAILFGVTAGSTFLVMGTIALSDTYGILLDGTAPTMIDRMVRDGVPSTCAAVKTYPGDFGTTAVYRYRASQIVAPFPGAGGIGGGIPRVPPSRSFQAEPVLTCRYISEASIPPIEQRIISAILAMAATGER